MARPNVHYLFALQDLADDLGLGHLLPIARVRGVPAQERRDGIRAE